ncbi:MAG: histidine kinase [Oleibacter sp.]|nr:histidine kinase [Thalassolituus sp.]
MKVNACLVNEDQRDCYQELVNVAMGQAADHLARLVGAYVVLPIPKVSLIDNSDLNMAMHDAKRDTSVSAVCQGFIGSGIAGEALLLFKDTSFASLASLLKYQGPLNRQMELELLMDTASVLIAACINGIGEQLEIRFNQGTPVILGQHCMVDDILNSRQDKWQKTLAIEIHYTLEQLDVDCDLLLLFSEESVKKLNQRIDFLLD